MKTENLPVGTSLPQAEKRALAMHDASTATETVIARKVAGDTKIRRLVRLVEKRFQRAGDGNPEHTFSVRTPDGALFRIGDGDASFCFALKNDRAVAALFTLDQNILISAYLAGDLDIEGDLSQLLAMRGRLSDKKRMRYLWRFIRPVLFGQIHSDRKWIAQHYDVDEAFFLSFLDKKHRAYSQAVFSNDGQSLEDAQSDKLDFALEAVRAAAGDHILEIGGGWGAFVEHACPKGMQVTSLTLSKRSESFIQNLIQNKHLNGRVLFEHFFAHAPPEKYDAIVNCGVTEHLPDYAASLRQYARLVKPGGYVYLDASAGRRKNQHGSFMNQYVFGGNASLLCLHEFLEEVAQSPFHLIGVWNDRHNYYLTTKKWAENLDRSRADIERNWGISLYRIFRLYLWGSAEGFHSGSLDAYRVLLRLPR